jgi:hypothetical protein
MKLDNLTKSEIRRLDKVKRKGFTNEMVVMLGVVSAEGLLRQAKDYEREQKGDKK